MCTLIAVYSSDGCVGRCDAKCYNAEGPECDCICGGVNHGAGLKQAVDNTRELADGWIEDYAQKHPEAEKFTVTAREPVQLELFA